MAASESNSFERFEMANAPKRVTGADYVHSIYKALNLPADFVLWFSRLLWPSLLIVDGNVFVADLFETQRYEVLRQEGHSASSAQFWSNLLEITGVFDDIAEPLALEFAQNVAAAWNCKIAMECADGAGRARVVHDKTTDEIFVSIGAPD